MLKLPPETGFNRDKVERVKSGRTRLVVCRRRANELTPINHWPEPEMEEISSPTIRGESQKMGSAKDRRQNRETGHVTRKRALLL